MIGKEYWATGIVVSYWNKDEWRSYITFHDHGFCDSKSTEGKLTTRYCNLPLSEAIDLIKADAERLGIVWADDPDPMLMIEGDGESSGETYPDDWRELLAEQAERIGWRTYTT